MEDNTKKPSQARRAILKGSLAAPVVLTVPSASLATTTTLGRCLANLDKGPQPAFFVADPSPDTWMRIQVQVYKLTEPNKTVICERAFIDPALAAANQLEPYKAYRNLDTYAQVSFTQDQIKTYTATPNGTVRALQWVDELHKTTWDTLRLDSPGSGYRHATGTCWSSFVKGA